MAQWLTRETAISAFREIYAQLDAILVAKNHRGDTFIAARDRLAAMIDRGALIIPAIPISIDLAAIWRYEDKGMLPEDGGAPIHAFGRRLAHFHSSSKRILDVIVDDVLWQIHASNSPTPAHNAPPSSGSNIHSVPSDRRRDDEEVASPAAKANEPYQEHIAIAGWTFLGKLGSGGGGDVFKAIENREEGLERAIKICSPYATDDDADLAPRFRSEANALARLQHRAIVRYISAGMEDGPPKRLFLIMELVTGENLRMSHSHMPFDLRVATVAEILEGVDHAHQLGIYHRDIKPSNIMIRASDAQAVLVDFGLAYIAGAERDDDRTRLPPGTPGYIPPEVFNDPKKSRDPRHDIFQCGVTLYQIVAGQLPRDHYVSLESIDVTLAGLDPIVRRAIAPNPADRFPRAAAFAAALRAWGDRHARARMMPPSGTAARLRDSLAEKLTRAAERVRVSEEREEAVRQVLRPVAAATEEAGTAAFRELYEHIADLAPHLRFHAADLSTTPPPEDTRDGRFAGALCAFTYSDSDRAINFSRAHQGTELWNTHGATLAALGRGASIFPLAWVIYQTGSMQSPSQILFGAIVVVEQEPMDGATPLTLVGHRPAPSQATLLASPAQIKEYVLEVLGHAMHLQEESFR